MRLITILFLGFIATAPVQASESHHKTVPETEHSATALDAEIVLDGEIRKGKKGGVMLRLKHAAGDGGFPLFWEELEPVHDSRIHLLIIDRAMSDYHHEHPVQIEKEGSFAFFLSPRTSCSYKVWAQVHFKGGKEEMVKATIPGAEDCSDKRPDRTEVMTQTVDGYKFVMTRDTETVKKGKDTMLTLAIAHEDGMPVATLEPVMGAFAHLVGFYEDYENIAHIHPLGEEPGNKHERGGPELKFHYKPDQAGLVKLFAQVKIDAKMVFAPFTFTVAE